MHLQKKNLNCPISKQPKSITISKLFSRYPNKKTAWNDPRAWNMCKILPWDMTGRDNQSVLERPFPVLGFFGGESDFFLGRPGTEEFVPEFLLLLLSRDKGTAGQVNFFVPGQ